MRRAGLRRQPHQPRALWLPRTAATTTAAAAGRHACRLTCGPWGPSPPANTHLVAAELKADPAEEAEPKLDCRSMAPGGCCPAAAAQGRAGRRRWVGADSSSGLLRSRRVSNARRLPAALIVRVGRSGSAGARHSVAAARSGVVGSSCGHNGQQRSPLENLERPRPLAETQGASGGLPAHLLERLWERGAKTTRSAPLSSVGLAARPQVVTTSTASRTKSRHGCVCSCERTSPAAGAGMSDPRNECTVQPQANALMRTCRLSNRQIERSNRR